MIRRRSLTTNTFAQATPQLLAYVFSFAAAPIVLNGLGLRNFGIWALTGALAQYGALLDVGIARAVSRFVALHEANRDEYAVGRVVAVGVLAVAAVALIGVAAAVVGGGVLGDRVGIPAAQMRFILVCSVAILVFAMFSNVIVAYAVGVQDMVLINGALSFATALNFVFSVGAIYTRPQLSFYAGANVVASAVGMATTLAVVVRAGLFPSLHLPHRRDLVEVISYSAPTQLVAIASLVNFQSDKIIIALFISPQAAGAYELANRVAFAARSVAALTVSAMVPSLTADIATRGVRAAVARYGNLTQRAAALAFPWLFLAAALAPSLLAAWLGQTPPDSILILIALALTYVLGAATGVGYSLAASAGRPGIVARSSLATAAANVVLTAAFAPAFGIWGVLVGTFVALTAGALYQVVAVHRAFEMPNAMFVDAVRAPFVLSCALAVPVAILAVTAADYSRVVQIVTVVGCSVGYAATYMLAAARLDILPATLRRRLHDA